MAEPGCERPQRLGDVFTRYVWLLYLVGIPIGLHADNASASHWALSLGGMAVFIALYVASNEIETFPPFLAIGAMFAIGLLFIRRDGAAMSYFIFGAASIGWQFPAQAFAYRVLVGYVALCALASWLLGLPTWVTAGTLVFSTMVGALNIRFAGEKRDAARLRLAYAEVERLTKVAERERIARDLHDVLGHTLSLIVLKSELAAKLVDRDVARAVDEVRDVERIARGSLAELRAAVAGYRSAGIAAELEHARSVFASAGVHLECEAGDLRLPAQHEGVLALAIREAVTNVVRHADAHAVRVRLSREDGICRFEIHDDGCGGNPADGAGLTGMRERVESLGGSLERRIENGTRLVVTLPA